MININFDMIKFTQKLMKTISYYKFITAFKSCPDTEQLSWFISLEKANKDLKSIARDGTSENFPLHSLSAKKKKKKKPEHRCIRRVQGILVQCFCSVLSFRVLIRKMKTIEIPKWLNYPNTEKQDKGVRGS